MVTSSHGGCVSCAGGMRAVARLERDRPPREARQPKLVCSAWVLLWVPDVHGDIPAVSAARCVRCLPGPASPCVSVRLLLGCGRMQPARINTPGSVLFFRAVRGHEPHARLRGNGYC